MSPAEGSISNMKDVHRLFLQRFMANRVMSDDDAKRLYIEVNNVINDTDNDDDDDTTGIDERQFHKFLGIIGSALRDAFDFDLRTIIIPSNSIGNTSGNNGGTIRYHAFVNRLADTPAKLYGSPNKNPHEISFFRLILEHIIDDGNSKTEDGDGGRNNNNCNDSGCQGSLTDIEIIHLRNELKGPHTNKMNSHDVENALLKFVNEQWLLQVVVNDDDDDGDDDSDNNDDNSNDDNGSNDDDEEEEEEEEQQQQQQKKKKKRSSTKKRKRRGRKRKSTGEVRYFICPRTYMELESVLKDLGLSDMPQSILYSSGGGGRH